MAACRVFCWVVFILGAVVVCYPQLFYLYPSTFDDSSGVVADDRSRMSDVDEQVRILKDTTTRTEARLHKLQQSVPWLRPAPTEVQTQLEHLQHQREQLQEELGLLLRVREDILAKHRAMSPVFSHLCFEEARNLYWQRQKTHASFSVRMWKWEMFFELFVGATSDTNDPWITLIRVIGSLLWRLTFGTIIGVLDFAARLPFYLREYETSAFEQPENKGELQPFATTNQVETTKPVIGRSDHHKEHSWFSLRSLRLMGVYFILLSGALVATGGMALLVWSPVIAVCCFGSRRVSTSSLLEHHHAD